MSEERRQSPRRKLKRPAVAQIDSGRAMRVQLVDVSTGGLCVMFPEQLAAGSRVRVEFDIPFGSALRHVSCTAKVANTVLVGMQGFRAGLLLVEIGGDAAAAIAAYTQDDGAA